MLFRVFFATFIISSPFNPPPRPPLQPVIMMMFVYVDFHLFAGDPSIILAAAGREET
jgi:hypothetical protein